MAADLLLIQPEEPLAGQVTQYYRYLDGARAIELVQTDAWTGDDWGGGWETRLLISQRTEMGWYLMQEEAVMGRSNAGDGVFFSDINFDGRTDFLVLLGHFGNQGAVAYTAFFQTDGGYALCPSFSNISNPSVDGERCVIYSQWRNWAESHSWAVYEYQNGAFTMTRCLTEEPVEEAAWQYIIEEAQPDGTLAIREVWRSDEHTKQEIADRFLMKTAPTGALPQSAGARYSTTASPWTLASIPTTQWGVFFHENIKPSQPGIPPMSQTGRQTST